jgi:hypothetical protein
LQALPYGRDGLRGASASGGPFRIIDLPRSGDAMWLQSNRSLTAVSAVGATALRIVWHDGGSATVDLKRVIARHPHFAFLHGEAALFATVGLAPKRRAVTWMTPAGVPCSLHVDALWRLQHGLVPPLADTPA